MFPKTTPKFDGEPRQYTTKIFEQEKYLKEDEQNGKEKDEDEENGEN